MVSQVRAFCVALVSPFFCEQAWRCLGAFRVVAIPQSGLLAQVSSLRLPLGHSGPVLTLSNEAQASLPSARLEWWMQASVLLLRWESYRWAHNL